MKKERIAKFMKKKIVAAIICAGMLVAFTSCRNTDTQPLDNNNVQQGQDIIDEGNRNDEELPTPEYSMKIEPTTDTITLKDTGNLIFTKTVERIRVTAQHSGYHDAAKNISSVMKASYERNELQAESLKNGLLESFTGENMTGLPWALEAKYDVESSGGKYVCFVEHVYYNAGGAYPTYMDFSYNFDAVTGKQLFLEDFFPIDDDEKTPLYDAMLREKLDAKYPDTVQDSFIQTNLINIAVDTWVFTENGMKIWYNEQEIAPHAAGKLEIELTREELPESALAYLD